MLVPMQRVSMPRHAWLASSVWALSVALSVATFGLLALPRTAPARSQLFGLQVATGLLFLLVTSTVGAVVAARYPRNPVGWVFGAAGLCWSVMSFAAEYAVYSLIEGPLPLPAAPVIAWLSAPSGLVGVALVTVYLPLLFPDGRLPSARWRPVAWLAALGLALLDLGVAFSPSLIVPPHFVVPNPFAIEGVQPVLARGAVGLVVLVGCAVAAAASLVGRMRRARNVERQQLKWLMYSVVPVSLALAITGALYASPNYDPASASAQLALSAGTVLLACIPLAAGVAILRYRLYDIDLLIHRTLVYSALTASVITVYVVAVASLGAVFRVEGNLGVSLVATGLVAVLFQPLRERVQRWVNHLLYGQRDEPYAVLSRLGQRLQLTLAPEAVLPGIVETVREALNLPYAGLALHGADGLRLAAESGNSSDELLRLPLMYQHEPVGELRLGARGRGEGWSPADKRLLEDLARQAGVAAHAVRLTAELQRSRERLVNAREEERRRLRRDLHDELAPTLAALALTAAAARDRGAKGSGAIPLLDELYTGLRGAVGDIRRLVYELRPPALDELGLVAAIRERAAAYNGSGAADPRALHVIVEAPDRLPPLPAAVEVAAYRIAQEALMNVARHAEAHTCTIRMTVGGGLQVEVIDDGRGLPVIHGFGVGLDSMRERAVELGGRFTIARQHEAGTCVRAWLPIDKEDPDGAGAHPTG